MTGKAVLEDFRVSWTKSTVMAFHMFLASQFTSFNCQKNDTAKKNRGKK